MADEGKMALRIKGWRARWPFFDHVMAMNEHYGNVQGSVLAGAVTYFGFLSFFPILALGFAVVGFISGAYPEARDSLITAIQQIFPGIVSTDGSSGTISLEQIESAKAAAGLIGFVGVLYSGLGWVSGLRASLEAAFAIPKKEKRNFVVGKAIDLVALGTIGLILIASVAAAGVVKGLADEILDGIGLDPAVGKPLLWVAGIVIGLAASTLLFYVMYRLLGRPEVDARPLWQGALLGAAGFEILKVLVVNVFGSVGGSAFAPLAIAITLVVWINYFSRLVFYGASWAMTAPSSIAARAQSSGPEAVESVAEARALAGVAVRDDDDEPRGRLDLGSAVLGAVAGFVAAHFFGREL